MPGPVDRPSEPSHLVQRRRGQAWVKKANMDRVRGLVDAEEPDEHEIEQRRMAHWLNTGTTLREGQRCSCKGCA